MAGLDQAKKDAFAGRMLGIRMLREAGLTRIDVSRLADDPINNYYVARKA